MAKVHRTLNLPLRKQGKYAKRKFHDRYVHLSGHTLMIYKDKAAHHDNYDTPKHMLDMRGKTIKARANKVDEGKANACIPKVKRFFIQIIDMARDKVVTVFEAKDRATAVAVARRLQKRT